MIDAMTPIDFIACGRAWEGGGGADVAMLSG